jgi:hypothetical protein
MPKPSTKAFPDLKSWFHLRWGGRTPGHCGFFMSTVRQKQNLILRETLSLNLDCSESCSINQVVNLLCQCLALNALIFDTNRKASCFLSSNLLNVQIRIPRNTHSLPHLGNGRSLTNTDLLRCHLRIVCISYGLRKSSRQCIPSPPRQMDGNFSLLV